MFVRVAAVTQLFPQTEDVQNNRDILWSLRPIILFARCVGVDFQLDSHTNNKNQTIIKRLILCYGLVCLLLNAFSQMGIARFLYQSLIYTSLLSTELNYTSHSNRTTIASWNNIIDFANCSIHNLSSHLVLLLVVRNRIAALFDSFGHFQFDPLVLTKIRKISMLGTIYTIVLVKICTKLLGKNTITII